MARSLVTTAGLALAASSGSAFLAHTPPASSRPATTTPSSTAGRAPTHQPRHRIESVGPLQGGKGYLDAKIFQPYLNFLEGIRNTEITLPQDPNADPTAREKELKLKQAQYQWSDARIPGLPYLDTPFEDGFPPPAELPTDEWVSAFVSSTKKILFASLRATIGISEIKEALSSPQHMRAFIKRIKDLVTTGHTYERAMDFDDFNDLYKPPVKTPEASYDFEDDDAFARLRLQGHNCVVMKKCTAEVKDKLKALDTEGYEALREKVEALFSEGKLFVVDHDALALSPARMSNTVITGLDSDKLDDVVDRYLMPSIALFEMVDDELLPIKPLGIQLDQGNAEAPTPIFTPDDDSNLWKIAKACFEAADFTIHEVVSHLSQTHLVMEGPMTAMNRQLPSQHPINALLRPHTEGTALINWGAQDSLIAKGGGVDRLCANKIEDAYGLIVQVTLDRMSKDFTPMQDLEDREMTTTDFPGRYPYRDQGLKYYDAIYTWVSDYLDIYYSDDDDVTEDYELQLFIDELVGTGLMLVADKVRKGSDKLGELKKLLASMIYTASCLHAAVNFPQRPIMSYVPMTPASVYEAAPTDKDERSENDYLKYLPPLGISTVQVILTTLLATIYYTQLGQYDTEHFTDKRVVEPLANFQEALAAIESDLEEENNKVVCAWRTRGKDWKSAFNFAYNTLLPDAIPQSINI